MKKSFPKFHPKHMNWLMPLLLSGIMSGAISAFNLLINKGWIQGFFGFWIHAWSLSWLIAFPLILVVLPMVRNFLFKFVHMPD